jgi:hypothetical protein
MPHYQNQAGFEGFMGGTLKKSLPSAWIGRYSLLPEDRAELLSA